MEADNWRISENLHDGARVIIEAAEERLEMAEAGRKDEEGRAWEIARRKQRLEVILKMDDPSRKSGDGRGWKKG
jgi:hypothetical protein